MKRVNNHVRFLVDNGLLFEINRKVLNPLGLALVADIHPDNSKWLALDSLMSVEDDDPEGFVYDEETYKSNARKYELYLLREGQSKLDSREEALGFIVQESDKDES